MSGVPASTGAACKRLKQGERAMALPKFTATAEAETFENDHSVLIVPTNISTDPNTKVIISKHFDFFEYTAVDYSNSTSAVFIDLERAVQHGGFAEGDTFTNIGNIFG